jgi:hypothetical protein
MRITLCGRPGRCCPYIEIPDDKDKSITIENLDTAQVCCLSREAFEVLKKKILAGEI